MDLSFLKGKFSRKDIWAVIIISSVPSLIYQVQLFFQETPRVEDPSAGFLYFCIGTFYSFIITSSLYFGCTSFTHYFNEKLPWEKNVAKRVVVQFILVFTYATIVQIIVITLFTQTALYDDIEVNRQFYFESILFGNTITLIVVILIEGIFFFQKWKESLIQAERLKQESLISQLNSLKNQLDPHFMFNSLNVLSSLIKKDSEKAEQFINDFAKVYRYVLEVKDEMVVSLSSELKFLESYTNLQKIRFGDALMVKVNINPRPMTLFLPPLCLQEVVSNAVKHNEVSNENPLTIELFNQGDILVVKNNLQRRNEELESTNLGLENIKQRYQLLCDFEPSFELTENEFIVKLPLLELDL